MKLCKDCKHFSGDFEFGKCLRPIIDPVVGRKPAYSYASVERMTPGWSDNCGPKGKYFDPKVAPQTTYNNLGIVIDHDLFETKPQKNVIQKVLEFFS